jgi:Tol biopolymer transport system component
MPVAYAARISTFGFDAVYEVSLMSFRLSSNMTLDRGTLLNNRYQIVEILGQGGMASIYRATDENLGVEVAVKENLFTTEEYARQFRREAVILASLRHPNLPRVTDHFVITGQGQYLIMDYIEGEDLRQRMDRQGTLLEDEVIVLGGAICEALAYLHSRRPMVLHRDVKPGNVKITSNGQIFLVDFGLAKVVQVGKATTTGARAMTPGYSPPEQYGTARTDQRSDVYSLGATLYSSLTDTLPEDGLARAMGQACLTPIRQHNPKISRKLAMVIEKALEVRPDDRYQSAEEMHRELISARSPSKRRAPLDYNLASASGGNGSKAEAKAAEAALPVAVENAVAGSDQEPPLMAVSTPLESSAPAPVAARRRVGGRGCWWTVMVIGVILAITGGLFIARPDTMQAMLAYLPLFIAASPTTRPLQATTPPKASTAAAADTVAAAAATTTDVPIPSLTPTRGISSTPTQSPSETPSILPTDTLTPAPTPLGGGPGQIAFASNRSGAAQIWMINSDGTGLVQITDIHEGACQPSWAPDGMRLVFISPCPKQQESYLGSSLFIVNVDGSSVTPLPTASGGDYDPAWSPDGRYIAFTSLRGDFRPKLFLLDLDNPSEPTLLTNEGTKNMQSAWSRDGKKLAFATTRRGPQQIWIMNADGSDPQLFTRSASLRNSYPAWAPDGTDVIFTQDEQGKPLPWLATASVGAEDTRGLQIYSDLGAPMREADYSPDGIWIVMEAWVSGENHDLFLMLFNGNALNRLTEDRSWEFDPVWRPAAGG